MLGKLLKYDLRWIFKEFLLLYPIILVDAILVAILPEESPSAFIEFLGGFAQGLLMAFTAVIVVTSLKLPWTRMSRNMYGDESYLTRTLPVSIKTVFAAKVLAGIVCMLASFLVGVVAYSIAYPDFWGHVAEFAGLFNMPTVLVVLTASVTFIAEYIFIMMAGFLGITIGYRARNQHFAWSAVATTVAYLVGTAVLAIIELIMGLMDSNIHAFLFGGAYDLISGMTNFIMVAMVFYIVCSATYYIAGSLIQKRGADID